MEKRSVSKVMRLCEGGECKECEPYLSYWRHCKLQRWARNGIAEVKLILLGETLILRVGRSAVSCDEGVHRDVVCGPVFFRYDCFGKLE